MSRPALGKIVECATDIPMVGCSITGTLILGEWATFAASSLEAGDCIYDKATEDSIPGFVKDEREYLAALNLTVSILHRMETCAILPEHSVLNLQAITDIFTNIRDLRDVTEWLVLRLHEAMRQGNMGVETVAIFDDYSHLFHVYVMFLSNLPRSMKMLERAANALPVLSKFLELEGMISGHELTTLLRLPQGRIKQYRNLLARISDYGINSKFDKSMQVMDYNKYVITQTMETTSIQELMFGGDLNIVTPDRYVVLLGKARVSEDTKSQANKRVFAAPMMTFSRKMTKPKKVYMTLFNDILILSDEGSSGIHKMRRAFRLIDLELRSKPVLDDETQEYSFMLFAGLNTGEISISFECEEDVLEWVAQLKKHIKLSNYMAENHLYDLLNKDVEESLKSERDPAKTTKVRNADGASEKWVEINMENGIDYFYHLGSGIFSFALIRRKNVGQRTFTLRQRSIAKVEKSLFTPNKCFECEGRALSLGSASHSLCVNHVTAARFALARDLIPMDVLNFEVNTVIPVEKVSSARKSSVNMDDLPKQRSTRTSRSTVAGIEWNNYVEPDSDGEESIMGPPSEFEKSFVHMPASKIFHQRR